MKRAVQEAGALWVQHVQRRWEAGFWQGEASEEST